MAPLTSAAELVTTLEALLTQVDEVVSRLSDEDLDNEVMFPFGQQQADDALSAALTHALLRREKLPQSRAAPRTHLRAPSRSVSFQTKLRTGLQH
jgi:hypothetical protein